MDAITIVITAIAISGSLCMGFVVMWIAFFILNRMKNFDGTAFGEIIAVFFGGTILNIYTTTLKDQPYLFWFYPIGLVLGMVGYHYLGGGNVKFRGFLDEQVAPAEPQLEDTKEGVT